MKEIIKLLNTSLDLTSYGEAIGMAWKLLQFQVVYKVYNAFKANKYRKLDIGEKGNFDNGLN
jgi:hypothetical protein